VPVIFRNPSGAPELACDECGCRWFDRMTGACYECGAPVPSEAQAEFQRELEAFAAQRQHTDVVTPGQLN
jgi:ribosomal protein L37E